MIPQCLPLFPHCTDMLAVSTFLKMTPGNFWPFSVFKPKIGLGNAQKLTVKIWFMPTGPLQLEYFFMPTAVRSQTIFLLPA